MARGGKPSIKNRFPATRNCGWRLLVRARYASRSYVMSPSLNFGDIRSRLTWKGSRSFSPSDLLAIGRGSRLRSERDKKVAEFVRIRLLTSDRKLNSREFGCDFTG